MFNRRYRQQPRRMAAAGGRGEEENGLLTYIGTRQDTRESGVAMREVLLDSKLTFSKPQDRLFAGQIDRMDRFALRFARASTRASSIACRSPACAACAPA
ncbi:hypothetical protein M8494_24040 [Serratia ureilytica]